ncbi:MAG: hydroxymethylpyrimidine/phosphomethylpyrimidine kinase [Taibaiella sp.]|nr:hydroxymethylpyrimidine/phosphomethylpyrimidine kinase [Taibaiella sp.]
MENYNTANTGQQDRPVVLSIAGFDPSAGAGVLADIKTLEQLKVKGMAVLTANTLQTEQRFFELEWQATATICRHIEILMQSYSIHVIKIGIVADAAMLQQIITTIRKQKDDTFIIWDPVLKSTSGFTFFEGKDKTFLKETLQQINLLTPNLPEFEQLKALIPAEQAILLKGGHRKEQTGLDILYLQGQQFELYPGTQNAYPKHGSGCVLSAAIAAHIALGNSIEASCRQGKKYVERFLNSHPTLSGYHYAE